MSFFRSASLAALLALPVVAAPMITGAALAHDRGGIRQLTAMDANRDGRVSRPEAKDFYDDLYRQIASLDGKAGVDADEFARAPEALGKQARQKMMAAREAALSERYNDMDYDGDGSLSEGEFIDAPVPYIVGREFAKAHDHDDRKRAKLFRKLDVSGDRALSRDEYLAAQSPDDTPRIEARRERAMQQRRAEFDRLDANDDGLMSRLEYLDVQWKRFDATDANKDDVLSREELRKARSDHGGAQSSGPTHLLPGIEDL